MWVLRHRQLRTTGLDDTAAVFLLYLMCLFSENKIIFRLKVTPVLVQTKHSFFHVLLVD